MQVFHGSYTAINEVDLSKCKDNKDFGRGFYVTKFRNQAEEWAEIIAKAHDTTGVVTEFTFYERAFTENSIKSLRFSEYNDEWFDFIILNRDLESIEQKHDYDIVEGPVADDKVQRHITDYLNGEILREEFFFQLTKYPKPSHQICFCTVNSLRMLHAESRKITYKVEGIGERIIEQLTADLIINEDKAADIFFSSVAFSELSNETTQLYQKPWQEIYELLKQEINKNKYRIIN